MRFDIEDIVRGIQNSYGDKYSENDYEVFRDRAKNIKLKRDMVSLVSNWFDLDLADARDMVSK